MEKEKVNYCLPIDFPMYDMCHCCANCATPCARKKAPVERICTVSDFSSTCSSYTAKEEK